MPTLATVYCTQADVTALLSDVGLTGRLDDNDDGVAVATEAASLTKAIQWASDRINLYCLPHYDVSELAKSVLVNDWTTALACWRLCTRRGNPVPDSIRQLAHGVEGSDDKGILGDLRAVLARQLQIPGLALRNHDFPVWSNVTVDPRYRVKQIRVQRPVSERTPTDYSQNIDNGAEYGIEL